MLFSDRIKHLHCLLQFVLISGPFDCYIYSPSEILSADFHNVLKMVVFNSFSDWNGCMADDSAHTRISSGT